MTIKAAIFDVDGTLVDTERIHLEAWREALRPFGAYISEEEYCSYVGRSAREIESDIKRRHGFDIPEGFSAERRTEFTRQWLRNGPLSARKYEVKVKLRRAGLSSHFSAVVAGDEVQERKPHPETYLTAAERLRLGAKECIAFEDTQSGVQSAKGAGLVCIAVPGEFSNRQDFSKADYVASDLKEAVSWVRANYRG